MPSTRVTLKGSYIQAGAIPLPAALRRQLPGPNEMVTVIDQMDNTYEGKVNGDGARINRMTAWHRLYKTADGVELELTTEPDRAIRVTALDVPPDHGSEPQPGSSQIALSVERDLQDFLAGNPEQIEAGLTLHSGRAHHDTEVGEIDVLAQDSAGALVVVELKAGRATDAALGQLLGYLGYVKEHMAKGREVRGIIVASDFSSRLCAAVGALGNVSLKRYTVSFKLTDVGGVSR